MTIALQQPLARLHAIWATHLAVLATLTFIAAFSFRDAVMAAIHVYMVSPTYSHCFLIIPIVVWLVWEKRHELAVTVPQAVPVVLALLLPLLLLWWSGEILTINEVRQFAVIAMIQVLVIAVLGWTVSRILWFPILYLVFLVPTGEYLIVPMQHFAASFVAVCLDVLGVPFFREGTTFELTNGRFEIAEACAGLRFLIATMTLSVLVAYMMFNRVYKWVAFLVASMIVPLVGNGLRCVGIILLAHFTNNAYGAGADHIVYGWGFNVTILMVMIFIGFLFRDRHTEEPARATFSPTGVQRSKLGPVTVVSFLLIGGIPALASLRQYQLEPVPAALTAPPVDARWSDFASTRDWQPSFPGADTTRWLTQVGGGSNSDPVELYIAYYSRPRTGHSLAAHANAFWNEHWSIASAGQRSVALGDRRITMQECVLNTPRGLRMIWSVYQVDHHFATEPLSLKLLQLRAAIDGKNGQAAIAFSIVISGTLESARKKLAQAIVDAGPLITLMDAGRATAPPTKAP